MELPLAKRIDKILTIHGDERNDPYYWMNERENPETIAYLEAENQYCKEFLSPTEEFQKKLYEEMVSRIAQTDMSVPVKENGYWYFHRFETGKEYPIYCRKKDTLDNQEEIILNVNELAAGKEFCQVSTISISPNNQWMAYAVDFLSRRIYTIHFKNLATNEVLNFTIDNCSGSLVWANDNATVFYTTKDETLRPNMVWRNNIFMDQITPSLVFEEKDETFYCGITKSKSKEVIFITSESTVSSEVQYIFANHPFSEFKIIEPRKRDLEYCVAHFNNNFYIITNHLAQNFRLMVCEINQTSIENWKEVIPHRGDIFLEDVDLFKNFMVLSERINGIVNLRVKYWDNSKDFYINFHEDAYLAYLSNNPEFDTETIRLGFTSLKVPNSIYDYNVASQEFTLLKQQEVVGGYEAENYISHRKYAIAADGTSIPISIIHHKDSVLDGKAPLLLYGYGSYGHSMDPIFSSVRLSLLDRGFVFAIAHIRGGQEMGRKWYEDGKLLHKMNTFTDFIACGEYLISNNFTSSNNLCAMGGSAGGLLIGAVINFRPDLWKAVIASVPFVDVLTTMLDDTIPLTTGEYDEWGNPNDINFYNYMKIYSPYDNVEAKAYPSIFINTGFHDSQVQYWEPAKWVAKLRYLKTDQNPLLFYTNMSAGHGGASGRFEQYKEVAMEYAFLLSQVGHNIE